MFLFTGVAQPLLLVATVLTTKLPALVYCCRTGFCTLELLPFGKCQDHCTTEVSGWLKRPRCCMKPFTQITESPPTATCGLSTTLIGLASLAVSTQAFWVSTLSVTKYCPGPAKW